MRNIILKRTLSFFFIGILFSFTAFAQERIPIAPKAGEPVFLKNETPADFTQGLSPVAHLTVSNPGRLRVRTGKVFTEGGEYNGITLPHLVSMPRAISYPRWAVRQGWQGELVLALEILENGLVGRFSVMKSTGYSLLDKAAIKAVQDWKFSPAIKDGKPLVTCIQIPILFQLQNE